MVGSNQGNYFENATACSKRMLKTTVATQLNWRHNVEKTKKNIFLKLNEFRYSILFAFCWQMNEYNDKVESVFLNEEKYSKRCLSD